MIISATADATSTVYVRWAMGPTNSSITYAGLYIDDINILAGGGAALTSASGRVLAACAHFGNSGSVLRTEGALCRCHQ